MTGSRLMAIAATITLCTSVQAAEIAPGDVEIVDGMIEASLTGVPGDAAKGKSAFVGRRLGNCLACHQVSSLEEEQLFHGEVGPSLDGVAEIYSDAELRGRIVNPKTVNEDSMMPSFYRTAGYNRVQEKFAGKTILSAQQVEDIIAYLKTLK